jgi:tetratricopeptide (TPR) repeat protein
LAEDWENTHANILQGFMYEAIGRPGLQRKHFAIAKVKRMRELNQLQPKNNTPKNFRTQSIEYPVEIIDYKNVRSKDEDMKPNDSDQMHFELIDLLLENILFKTADKTLSYIIDTHSNQYLLTKARIRIMQRNYDDATEALDELLEKNKDNVEAWIMRGQAYFLGGNMFDSEESFINAIRLQPNLKDQSLQMNLGMVYIKRKAWKDARTVFLKCVKEQTSFQAWAYLGYSLLKMNEL